LNNAEEHIRKTDIDHLFRGQSGKMVAVLTRIFGFKNLALIEDIVQDTFYTAMKVWPSDDYPDNPSAWLMRVARNKAINRLKRENRGVEFSPENISAVEEIDQLFLEHQIKDSQQRILFACCAPELPVKSQIALTLKILSGFSNREIGRALLMNEEAVKKMVYRAKKLIRDEEIKFGIPFKNEISERIKAAQMVLYLMFNEGYKQGEGDQLIKEQLCFESIRLTQLLIEISEPEKATSYALLALMYFNTARFASRLDEQGDMVDLQNQDRSKWDQKCIRSGFYCMRKARAGKSISRFHIEAGISAIHCTSESYKETDWNAIVKLYEELLRMEDNPVVRLNYTVAKSWLMGPKAGLKSLDKIDMESPIEKYFLMHASRADMYFRLGDYERAKSYYQVALDMAESSLDKRFIQKKMMECDTRRVSPN